MGERIMVPKVLSYEEAKQKADVMADKLGMPIDENIKPLVIALWMAGIKTDGSCEGHLDFGCPYPWIDIAPESSEKAFFTIMMMSPQNHDKEKRWVFHPRGLGKWFRITPWDVKRPLPELHNDVKEIADFLSRILDN